MSNNYINQDTASVTLPVLTAQAIAVGDLVGLSAGNAVRAEDTTWDTDLATTQAAYVATFVGVSEQRKVATVARVYGNSADNEIQTATSGIYEFDCASTSFAFGDLVGPAKQSGNALESQKVVAVASERLAIGRVVEATSSATKVKVRLLSVKAPLARQNARDALATAIVSLTDSTTGTANDTVADVGSSFSQSTLNNNFADVIAKINAIIAALRTQGIIATS